jgi:hypothetical protein
MKRPRKPWCRVTFVADGADPVPLPVRVRALLKVSLRRFGLRAVWPVEFEEAEKPARPTQNLQNSLISHI